MALSLRLMPMSPAPCSRIEGGTSVAPSARASATNHRQTLFPAAGGQQNFVRHAVNRVEDKIVFRREQFVGGLRVEEFLFRCHAANGIDGADAFGHHLDFCAANGFGERVKLAVDVAFANFVQVHQRQRADAGTHQRFRRPRAHAADTDDTDMRGPKPFKPASAVKPRDAVEAFFEIGHRLFGGSGST